MVERQEILELEELVDVRFFGEDLIINGKLAEIKGRAKGLKGIYQWLEDRDILFIRADRKECLVIQRLKDWKSRD